MKHRLAIIGSDKAAEQAWNLCPGIEVVPQASADLCHVSVPLPEREVLVEKLVSQGRSVLCRPPIGGTPEAIRRIAGACPGARLHPFYPARFNPRYRRIKASVARGDVGKPCIVRLEWLFCREDGGPFTGLPPDTVDLMDDLVLQQIDLVRWIVDDHVERVMAQAASVRDPSDHVQITLNFAGGALAFLECSLAVDPAVGAAGYLDLKGTKGIITDRPLDGFQPLSTIYGGSGGRPIRLTAEHPDWPADLGKNVGFLFHAMALLDAPPPGQPADLATPDDDALNLRVLLALRQSLSSRLTVEVRP